MKKILISPSILSANFLNLAQEIKAIEDAKADILHTDIMDGHFVPNLTFGPMIIEQIKKNTDLPIEAHLMISNTESVIEDYIKTNVDTIIIHAETCKHLDRVVSQIKNSGISVGVALNPTTCQSNLNYVIEKIDLVLVMTVNPGFGGQKFLDGQIKKIESIKNLIIKNKLSAKIEVDGGINSNTAKTVKNAGADILVAGSYIFKSQNYKEQILKLRNI